MDRIENIWLTAKKFNIMGFCHSPHHPFYTFGLCFIIYKIEKKYLIYFYNCVVWESAAWRTEGIRGKVVDGGG